MFEEPSTIQRPLLSNFARTGSSGSGCGVSTIVDVSHVGATQAPPASSARRTVSRMTIGVVVFGYRNVSFELVVSPLSATVVPLSCDHWYFAPPIEPEP